MANINHSGKTVLGPSAEGASFDYLARAIEKRASYYKVHDATWETWSDAEKWAANQHFLDEIAARGDTVLVSVAKGDVRPVGWLRQEIDYLTEVWGYRWVNARALKPR